VINPTDKNLRRLPANVTPAAASKARWRVSGTVPGGWVMIAPDLVVAPSSVDLCGCATV
jgi:hypothetical protein